MGIVKIPHLFQSNNYVTKQRCQFLQKGLKKNEEIVTTTISFLKYPQHVILQFKIRGDKIPFKESCRISNTITSVMHAVITMHTELPVMKS